MPLWKSSPLPIASSMLARSTARARTRSIVHIDTHGSCDKYCDLWLMLDDYDRWVCKSTRFDLVGPLFHQSLLQ